jgi:7-cyano-7-deazaguanine reductase
MSNSEEYYGELGVTTSYDSTYNPKRLFAIARRPKWQELGLDPDNLPFVGLDTWNHYEVSWLNSQGKPCVATARLTYDCLSPYLVESKSLKLYFNSLNQTTFTSVAALEACITQDLVACLQSDTVRVDVFSSNAWGTQTLASRFSGVCVDDLDVACSVYDADASLLLAQADEPVEEILCSDLLRSNCPVTNQPDWGSVEVRYQGPKICPESFLKYIVSFRNHQGFHEQCIEQIFIDILHACKPDDLVVYGRYTRRGGLDINPYRAMKGRDTRQEKQDIRLIRQ